MGKLSVLAVLALLLVLALVATVQAAPSDQACWGQVSKVYAKMGDMGPHASEPATPRDGLRNLARYLYEEGAIDDDTMQALGAFVATEFELTIDACGTSFP